MLLFVKPYSLACLALIACTSPAPNKKTAEPGPAHNSLSAAEQAGGWQLLFDGKSLQGWHRYGHSDTSGWKVENGEMIALGAGAGSDLLSDAEYDSFELSVEWKLSEGGNSGIFFLVQEDSSRFDAVYHTGPEYQLLDDSGWQGKLQSWQKTGANYAMHSAPGAPIRPAGEWNSSRLVVEGPRVEHWLNGQRILTYELWTPEWERLKRKGKWKDYPDYGIARSGRIALQDHGKQSRFRNVKIRPLKGKALFNGDNLEGWQAFGTENWFVQNGELCGESGPDKQYGYLATRSDYRDFELEVEFKQIANGNSGVFFRSSLSPGSTQISGWQAEIAPPGHDTGGIYESYGRGWLALVPDEKEPVLQMGEWNHLRIRAEGARVKTWLNGTLMADLEDEKIGDANGRIALQIHDGGGIRMRWRHLRITELSGAK